MLPLTPAQAWVQIGAWQGTPPQLDDDDRLGWATFADPGAVVSAIEVLKPAATPFAVKAKATAGKAPLHLSLADIQKLQQPTMTQVVEEVPRELGPNEDIKGLIHQAYVYSQLPKAEWPKNYVPAGIVVGRLIDQAKPEDVQKARDELVARWDKEMKAAACQPADSALVCAQKVLSILFSPWWWLRSDDGKKPVIRIVAESAMLNPNRPLASILAGFAAVKPEDRAAVTDAVRAFLSRAWEGALGPARLQFVDAMRVKVPPKKLPNGTWSGWWHEPWAAVLPSGNQDAPAKILVANQGKTKDGGMFDDPSDDTAWEKVKFYVQDSVREWDPSILKNNPAAQFYSWAEEKAEAAKDIVKKAAEGAGGFLKNIGLVIGGVIGVAVAGGAVIYFVKKRK
jgi:hypothetical protein